MATNVSWLKVRAHILIPKHEAKSMLKPQNLSASSVTPLPTSPHFPESFPDSPTNRGASIQTQAHGSHDCPAQSLLGSFRVHLD